MNDKKKLAVTATVLLVAIVVSAMIYNAYKDKVDPSTGQLTHASQLVPISSSSQQEQDTMATAASDFMMQDANGNDIMLSNFKDTPVVINFWTSWCNYCKGEMPDFEEAYKKYGEQIQFIMLDAVKSEKNSEDGRKFIENSEYTFPVFYETEGKAMTLYGLRGFPATIFIDKEGNIIEKHIGKISKEKLNESLEALINQSKTNE